MTQTLDHLRDALRLAPDPEDARRRLELLVERGLDAAALAAGGENAAAVLRIACAQAPYRTMLAARDPGRLLRAAADPHLRRRKPSGVFRAELAEALAGVPPGDDAAFMAALRRWRGQEIIRLGARECGLGQPEEVGRELAALADVAYDAALAFHDAELARQHGEPFYLGEDGAYHRARLCVIGMGKMGGQELNFSSDVDVIYLYPSDEGAAGSLSLHEYFDRLCRRITRAIGEVTEDDVVFRVDLRLRPEGSRGAICNSLPSAERYYEAWGRPWERQAWLKARPSAGDLEVGHEMLRILEPFIYPRHTSPEVISEVAELNRKIKAELDTARLGGGFDVKVGQGGIREVEFFVQALQLIHAGKHPSLRERTTRKALDKLLLAGLIAERERAQLADAYGFLRQVEHILQLESGAQTQRLPADVTKIRVIAERLGFADPGEFLGHLRQHTDAVAHLFATLGSEAPPPPDIAVLLDPERGDEATLAALGNLGFSDPPQALLVLETLRKRPLSPLSGAAPPAAARLAPALLKEIAASPDPDQALAYLADLTPHHAGGLTLWTLLDENPPLLRLLVSLLGTSAFLARAFVEHPELIDGLLLRQSSGPALGQQAIAARVDERLAELPEDDDEGIWNGLRRVRYEELLRIGLADISGAMDVVQVGERLSDLAEVCVRRTLESVARTMDRRYGRVPRMAVLGLGKLGARELGYAADLDLIFVYEGELEDHELATRLAQRLTNALAAHMEAGRLYEVDARLRPSGNQGTLVSSFTGWKNYHDESSQLWERQALIKLRAVAGDAALGRLVEDHARDVVFSRAAPARLAEDIDAMRARIEKELAKESPGAYDIKAGKGGLIDIEFAAQYLQLAHGGAHPALRVRGTVAALEAAAAAGVLDPGRRDVLVGAWRFLRKLEHRMRIVHDRAIHELPQGAELVKLARRMGLSSAGALERAYLVWTRDVRACYVELLGAGASAT
jgi:glutamate-ammonia-ligase adenylyltransferase